MEALKITITIDTCGNDNIELPCKKSRRKSVSCGSVDSIKPLVDEAFNRRMEAVIEGVAAIHGNSPERRRDVIVIQRERSPIRSPMPPLPYVPRHTINNAWGKVPPIAKQLTVSTGPGTVKLTWNDGISLGSYHIYAVIAGHELFGCVLEGSTDYAKWELLTFIQALPPSRGQRKLITCEMSNLDTGVEYYFAVRPVDVHDRRGPCATVYTRLSA